MKDLSFSVKYKEERDEPCGSQEGGDDAATASLLSLREKEVELEAILLGLGFW
jgi:hypothetical protein